MYLKTNKPEQWIYKTSLKSEDITDGEEISVKKEPTSGQSQANDEKNNDKEKKQKSLENCKCM